MNKHWRDISLISKVNSVYLFEHNNKKYYIIGDAIGNGQCDMVCDQINQYPNGNECTTLEALLSNWLKYNNEYNIATNLYLNTDNLILRKEFDTANQLCYQREKKCPYYPNIDVYMTEPSLYKIRQYINTLDIKNINVQNKINELSMMMITLIHYYNQLGEFIFNGNPIKTLDIKKILTPNIYHLLKQQFDKKYEINDLVKEYGSTYMDYVDQLIYEHRIDNAELYLILNQIKDNDEKWDRTKLFMDHYLTILEQLFSFLNNLEILSHMFDSKSSTFIVVTEQVEEITLFFNKLNIYNTFAIASDDNCLKIQSSQITADEFRWYLYKNVKSKDQVKNMTIKEFNLTLRPQRAGVIMYTKINNKLYFGFGVDSIYNELTDFGGHLDRKDKNAITGALREFREESLGLFNYTYEQVKDNIISYDDKMAILFIKVNESPEIINQKFKNKLNARYKNNVEVNDIVWLSLEDLLKELYKDHSKIYTRVKNHLIKSKNFYDLLK